MRRRARHAWRCWAAAPRAVAARGVPPHQLCICVRARESVPVCATTRAFLRVAGAGHRVEVARFVARGQRRHNAGRSGGCGGGVGSSGARGACHAERARVAAPHMVDAAVARRRCRRCSWCARRSRRRSHRSHQCSHRISAGRMRRRGGNSRWHNSCVDWSCAHVRGVNSLVCSAGASSSGGSRRHHNCSRECVCVWPP